MPSIKNGLNCSKISSLKKIFYLFCAIVAACSPFAANSQTIFTVAGTGTAAYSGDGGAATLANINVPHGVATDAAGNVYFTDYNNHRIRKISTTGVITTIAGTGFGGYLAAHDGGPATAAWIKWPIGIAVGPTGIIYFSDYGNNIIRKIDASGIITTIAGVPGSIPPIPPGPSGDGLPATSVTLGNAWGVAIDGSGNVIIADAMCYRVRKINTTTGLLSNVAGNGLFGFAGDGGAATAAACRVNEPSGVAVDAAGNIYIADYGNNRIRMINTSGVISTIAGVGLPYGYSGDGGPASAARFYSPKGIAVDNSNNIYICDGTNNAVRKINTSGIINTIAGTGVAGYSGDGIPALSAQLNTPTGVAVRYDGDVFIADNNNSRVRRIKIGNDPYFTLGISRSVVFCPAESNLIDTLMRVDDIDVGQTLTWSPVQLPAHATLVATATATSTGSTVTPGGILFIPSTGYTGLDTFKVKVTDGTYSDTITIFASIIAAPVAGVINGPDSVCPGYNITLTDTVAGGIWSSSNTARATVSTAGVVTGVSPGTVTITYTVTNTCGTAFTTFPVEVLATIPCISSVSDLGSIRDRVQIVPNPNSGTFAITLPANAGLIPKIEIYNVTGVRVSEYVVPFDKPTKIVLDQPVGIYYICVYTAEGKLIKKLHIEK